MKEIIVYGDWLEKQEPVKMGILRVESVRNEEIFSFEYNDSWLKKGQAQELDPELKLYSGRQYLSGTKPNFGIFLDSAPDRWGRMLMDRQEALTARREQRPARKLKESDYLLRVNDKSRMGALRFKSEETGAFLSSGGLPIPPMTSIRELEHASFLIEDDDFFTNKEAYNGLALLMVPGSSLGGARPKASVRDPEGGLWIAKFPSKNDNKDSGAWEYIVNQLAAEAGITVATATAECFSGRQHTFLTKRFDRTPSNGRIHFSSAMTLLGYKDGHSHRDGGSYLELVELIENYGARPDEDIRELWQRIVFSVAVSNTDDHLRNHGFLLTPKGWKLSPAYDMNPNENGTGLVLNISENDNSLDFDLCLEVSNYYRWQEKEAAQYIKKIRTIVNTWKLRAEKMHIPHTEQIMMERAFNV